MIGDMQLVHYIVIVDGSSYFPMYDHMLQELKEQENITIVLDKPNSSFLKYMVLKRRFQKVTRGKLDFLVYEQNTLYHTISNLYKSKRSIRVIFLNAALNYNPYTKGTLCKYKRLFPGIKYVLFYLDIMGVGVSMNADYLRKADVFDLVYTIDSNDAKKTNSILWNTFYSSKREYLDNEINLDMYFCGVSKNRGGLLIGIAEACMSVNANVEMDVIPSEDKKSLEPYDQVIHIMNDGQYLLYHEVLKRELKASCILEIVQDGQTAMTLRPYEAVVYNKKLLTNCKGILNFSFYDSRYMKYFQTLEEIDWNWVKSNIKVNYGYDGEFSPLHLIDNINYRLSKEESV